MRDPELRKLSYNVRLDAFSLAVYETLGERVTYHLLELRETQPATGIDLSPISPGRLLRRVAVATLLLSPRWL